MKAKYEEERNDAAYVPADCKIALVLKPVSAVEKDPGFKDLLRETEAVVVECRKLLKIQTMKCADLNVKASQDKITGNFAKALPVMAKLLLALEGIENANKHDIVSDLLKHDRDNAISFLNVSDPHFRKIYCEVNGIDDIPSPSTPPLFNIQAEATTPQQGLLNLRGGAGNEPTNQQLRESRDAVAAANQGPPALDLGLTQPPTFDYDESAFSQRQIFDEGGSNGNIDSTNPPIATGAPLAQATGASNNNANIDNATNDQIMGNSDNNNGGGTGTPTVRPPTPNPYNTGGNGFQSAAQQLRRGKLQKVHKVLLLWIERLYVEPRLKYDSQVAENEVTTHIKKAAKSMTMTEQADKIAEAVSAESVPDPKIVKVLIKDAVEKKFKEAATASKKQKQKKLPPSSTSSKDVRGSQRKGGASLKKKSPTNPSDDTAGGKGTATAAAKSRRGKPPTKKKNGGRGKSSKTKRSKSQERLKKG